MTTSADLRASAAAHAKEAADSYDRCDTDGFVSQWASGLNAQKDRLDAQILDNGGTAEFPALFTLSGEWTPARLVNGTYGTQWQILDATGRPLPQWLPFFPARRSTLTRRGYVEGYVTRPAKAAIQGGTGRGLSGASNCFVTTIEADRPHDPPLSIITSDRFDGLETIEILCPGCLHDGRGPIPMKRSHKCLGPIEETV